MFESKGSSSGRQLYIRVWYGAFYMPSVSSLVSRRVCICNRLPEDEPSGSKHVEDTKNLKTKLFMYKMYIVLICVLCVVLLSSA